MLTNAAAGAVLVAMYLVVLVLQLNPHVPALSPTAARWFVALLAMYGPYLSALLFLLMLALEAIASRPLRPAWFSLRLIAWLGSIGAAAAAWITWANLRGFRAVLPLDVVDHMRQGAIATTIFAVVLLTVAALRYSLRQRGGRMTASVLVLSMTASVAVPLWLRVPGDPVVPVTRRPRLPQVGALPFERVVAQPPRVRLLLVDGASLGFIRHRVAAGLLPNFGKLLDRGASIDLATLRPTQVEPVWAAAATGKYPPLTGIRSQALYRVSADEADPVDLLPDYCFAFALPYQGFVRPQVLTKDSLRARPLWDILTDFGLASGIVNWPLTRPAQASRGYVISDVFDEVTSEPLRLGDAQAGDPSTAVDIAREAFDLWHIRTLRDVMPSVEPGEAPATDLIRARWDRAYADAAAALEQQFAPRLTAVRYEGVDDLGHTHLLDAVPEQFGAVRRGDPHRSLLDRYYAFIDSEVGRAINQLDGGDILFVVSGFGMEPNSLVKRSWLRLRGEADQPGTHEWAPDGFLLAYGGNVAPGQYRRGSIVDLAPTVLYYMGVPVGRDMDGFARTDIFRGNFTLERPVAYTPTHEK
jgi:hypothetical protein